MKKRISALLLIVALTSCEPKTIMTEDYIIPSKNDVKNLECYKRVVIFGIDGAGGALEYIDTPNFDNIFSTGSINYHGVAQIPTSSAENWSSMFYGVTADTHKKNNDYISLHPHVNTFLPSVFKTYSSRHIKDTFFSVVNWTPINKGIFENFDNFKKVNVADIHTKLNCYQLDEKVADYAIERLNEYDDTITFLQFESVDNEGHLHGADSKSYEYSIQVVDGLIGRVYSAYLEHDMLDSTLFICVSDHGHLPEGGHGGETEQEKAVTIAVNGNKANIIQGTTELYYTHYLASIILYALGETQPSHYEGGIPYNLFNTLPEKPI